GHYDAICFHLQMGPTEDNDHCGQRTDHDGIDKGPQHGHQTLPYRFLGLGLSVKHRGRSHTGLIGKYRTPYSQDDKSPKSALNGRFKIERLLKDKDEGRPYLSCIYDHDIENGKKIKQYHKGNYSGGHLGNLLQSSKDHK